MDNYLQKLFSIGGLVIGVLVIVFRKSFVRGIVEAHRKKSKPKEKEQFRQLDETGYSRILYIVMEVSAVVAGIFFITLSLWDFLEAFGIIK